MRFVVGGLLLLLGAVIGTLSLGWVITGKNYGGFLGRGVSNNATQKLQRAPAVYFRPTGATVAPLGAMLVLGGVLTISVPDHPSQTYLAVVLFLCIAMFAALIVCGIWLWIVATRYKLRRWDRP